MIINNSAVPAQLLHLFESEQAVKSITVNGNINVALNDNHINLEINNILLHSKLDRPIIHQIGGRVWPEADNYYEVKELWDQALSTNPRALEQQVSEIFRNRELIVRYQQSGARNLIYGVVTKHFVYSDQLVFRELFIAEARRASVLNVNTSEIEVSKYGEVTEFFAVNRPKSKIGYKYGLTYAKNNGYDAYDVKWGRLVLVCTNGLTRYTDGGKAQWKHTNDIEIKDFLEATLNQGSSNQQFLERRLEEASGSPLLPEMLGEFMERLHVSVASKTRITKRLEAEAISSGLTEWSLSQALTWLGSHERSIDRRPRELLTEAGTSILEKSLPRYLDEDNVYARRDGYYGALLPTNILQR